MLPTGIAGAAAQALGSMQDGDPLIYQQYLDFFKVRRFHRTLLCRQAVDLQRVVDPALMMRFHYSAPIDAVAPPDPAAPADSVAYRNRFNEVTVTTSDPASRTVLAMLAAAWPASLPFDDLAAAAGDRRALSETLHTYYASSFVNVHLEASRAVCQAGDRPLVWRVARLEASLGTSVPHLHHGAISIDVEAARDLLQLIDGSRSRSELAAACGSAAALDAMLQKMARAAILLA